jgi:hypothetical protein
MTRPRDKRQFRYMRQTSTLTGLGQEYFADAIQAIKTIETKFAREIPEDKLIKWTPNQFDSNIAIELSNRYFVYKTAEPTAISVPMDPTIDPQGLLKNAGDNLIHTSDNVVEYYQKQGKLTKVFIHYGGG